MDVYKRLENRGTGKEGRYIASKASEKGYHMRMLVRNQKSQLIVK